MQDLNVFGCKSFGESIFLGLYLTLDAHTPVYKHSKYPLPAVIGSLGKFCKVLTISLNFYVK